MSEPTREPGWCTKGCEDDLTAPTIEEDWREMNVHLTTAHDVGVLTTSDDLERYDRLYAQHEKDQAELRKLRMELDHE